MGIRAGLFFSLAAFLLSTGPVLAQDGVLLRYDFPKEEDVLYRTTTEMSQTMQMAGQTYENKVTQTEVNAISLAEVTKEDHLKLRYANQRLSVKADMGRAGNYNFDSDSTEREKGTALSSRLNPVYETLSGAEYQITITPRGEIEKLVGYQDVLENLTRGNPLAAQFTGGGEKAQKESLAEVFFVLPEKPARAGDTWEEPFEVEIPQLGTVKGKRIYKCEGPASQDDDSIMKISLTVEASFDFDLNTDGAKVTGNIVTDSSKGDIRFDVQQGQVISAALEYTLSGSISTLVGERTMKSTITQKQSRSTQRISGTAK